MPYIYFFIYLYTKCYNGKNQRGIPRSSLCLSPLLVLLTQPRKQEVRVSLNQQKLRTVLLLGVERQETFLVLKQQQRFGQVPSLAQSAILIIEWVGVYRELIPFRYLSFVNLQLIDKQLPCTSSCSRLAKRKALQRKRIHISGSVAFELLLR